MEILTKGYYHLFSQCISLLSLIKKKKTSQNIYEASIIDAVLVILLYRQFPINLLYNAQVDMVGMFCR